MTEKITYLDGLRGVAAINVMVFYFFTSLAPAMIHGRQFPDHSKNFNYLFSTTPLRLIADGGFSVSIFFVLKGYVLTQKYFKTRDNNVIISGTMRRYIRFYSYIYCNSYIIFSILNWIIPLLY